jgi:hypothetical protein
MNEFQKWLLDVQSYNYDVDDILEQLKILQDAKNWIKQDYVECENKMKLLQQQISLIHAKKRYFEILLEKVAR